MGTIRHSTLTSELAGEKVGATEWDAAHDIDLAIADISGLTAALAAKADDSDLSGYVTTSALTTALAAKYDASNPSGYITSAALSGYATTAAVAAAYQPLATVLTNTTASFTTAQETKLAAISGTNTGDQTAASLGLGTGDSPQFAGVNLGHASDTTITRTGAGQIAVEGNAIYHAGNKPTESLVIACSDETTAITTGTAKVTFRMPYAFTLTAVRASVTTAPTGSTIIIDINEGGTTILSTKLSIDASEKTSTTAASAAVISDTSLADDAEITIDFDQVGSTIAGAGVKVYLIGTRT